MVWEAFTSVPADLASTLFNLWGGMVRKFLGAKCWPYPSLLSLGFAYSETMIEASLGDVGQLPPPPCRRWACAPATGKVPHYFVVGRRRHFVGRFVVPLLIKPGTCLNTPPLSASSPAFGATWARASQKRLHLRMSGNPLIRSLPARGVLQF